jgi:hypothetical protein
MVDRRNHRDYLFSEEQKLDQEMRQQVVLDAKDYAGDNSPAHVIARERNAEEIQKRERYHSGHPQQLARTRVFLGGTCNDSKWRETLIPMLVRQGFDYFDPVVPDWTPECKAIEIQERESCDVCLYVLTPKMTGVYSVAEVVDDSNKRPRRTVLCVLSVDDGDYWTEAQSRSIQSVADLVRRNRAAVVYNLESVVEHLNLARMRR